MIFRKTTFFLLLFLISIAPFVGYKLVWLANSRKAIGTMQFKGKSITGLFEHRYAVISFMAGKDTVWFNGADDVFFEDGTTVPVRYQKNDPSDAKISSFFTLWADTLVYASIPVVILLMLFLHPAVVPWRAKIRVTRRKPYLLLME
ncbi:MAG: hypothetical protein QM731_02440 [Chitinophagaceae bacterium]